MSHRVQINYENIAYECNVVCELANKRIEELNDILHKMEDNSSRILNDRSMTLKKSIIDEIESIASLINEANRQASLKADLGIKYSDSDYKEYRESLNTVSNIKKLEERLNEVASSKIIEFEALLNEILIEEINENNRRLNDSNYIPEKILSLIDSIESDTLKHFTYLAYIKNRNLSGDALLEEGKNLMDFKLNKTYEERLEIERAKIKEELELARVDKTIIDKVINLDGENAKEKLTKIRQSATTEIVDEKIRQRSIKIIRDAITKRGFIVDKKNIKINREKNEVNIVALKPNGQRADFTVFLDGKFIYDFHQGYKGQACQEDIVPFMTDLEEVYGIKVTNTKELWANPDKISTMKYQQINTNKNRG